MNDKSATPLYGKNFVYTAKRWDLICNKIYTFLTQLTIKHINIPYNIPYNRSIIQSYLLVSPKHIENMKYIYAGLLWTNAFHGILHFFRRCQSTIISAFI